MAGDPQMELVAKCCDGASARDALVKERPDVAIFDLDLQPLDGLSLAKAAADLRLPTRVLLMSHAPCPQTLYDALAAGVSGLLSKRSELAAIRDAIKTIAAGDTLLGRDLHAGIAHEIRSRSSPKPVLSSRELEVLTLVAQGRTGQQIADELILGVATIRTHMKNAYDKLGVHDKSSAVAEAMRRGLPMEPRPTPRLPVYRPTTVTRRVA